MNKNLKTVNEVSKLTGVSIRTLHYYDEIGLLSPYEISEAGYRLYDDNNLERLQDIMLFRELEFPLKEIKTIFDSPDFDRRKALDGQIKLLELRREHLDGLIVFAKQLKRKGDSMSFKPFDNSKVKQYEELAKQAWGETKAFKEYEEKSANYSDRDKRALSEKMMDIFYEFGDMKDKSADDEAVQNQVKKLQDFITENYYKCTDEILACLGQMYVGGGEMTTNIDVAGGKGCAEFVAEAIKIYCNK